MLLSVVEEMFICSREADASMSLLKEAVGLHDLQ